MSEICDLRLDVLNPPTQQQHHHHPAPFVHFKQQTKHWFICTSSCVLI